MKSARGRDRQLPGPAGGAEVTQQGARGTAAANFPAALSRGAAGLRPRLGEVPQTHRRRCSVGRAFPSLRPPEINFARASPRLASPRLARGAACARCRPARSWVPWVALRRRSAPGPSPGPARSRVQGGRAGERAGSPRGWAELGGALRGRRGACPSPPFPEPARNPSAPRGAAAGAQPEASSRQRVSRGPGARLLPLRCCRSRREDEGRARCWSRCRCRSAARARLARERSLRSSAGCPGAVKLLTHRKPFRAPGAFCPRPPCEPQVRLQGPRAEPGARSPAGSARAPRAARRRIRAGRDLPRGARRAGGGRGSPPALLVCSFLFISILNFLIS